MSQQAQNLVPGKKRVRVLRRDVVRANVVSENTHLSARLAEAFKEFVERRGVDFLQEIDAWLASHESDDPEDTDMRRIRLGVRVCLTHDEDPEG